MKITDARFAGSSVRVDGRPARRLPEVAFIGRSNVGKSSLINMLCARKGLAMTSSTPGKTRLVNHFLINDSWYLVDLPGYGYAKMGKEGRERLREVVADYIFNSRELAALFVLVDSRHDIGRVDLDFLAELGENRIPFCMIYTKCDKLGPNALKAQMERNEALLLRDWEEVPPCLVSSSQRGDGREEILDYVERILNTL